MTAMPPAEQLRSLVSAQKFIRAHMMPVDLNRNTALLRGGVTYYRILQVIEPSFEHHRNDGRRRRPGVV